MDVSVDKQEMVKKVQGFVDKYNSVVSYIKSNNRYNSEAKIAQPLYGESIARSVLEDLRGLVSSEVPGRVSTMSRLINLGIETKQGMLSFDTAKLEEKFLSNMDDVVNLFTDAPGTDGFSTLLSGKIDQMTDFVDGRLTAKSKGLDKNIDSINDDIDKKEFDLSLYEEKLRIQFASLEALLVGLQSQSSFLASLQQGPVK